MDDLEKFCGSKEAAEALRRRMDPTRRIYQAEQIERFMQALDPLYWQAVRIKQRGISWRKFYVGCAMWSFRADASRYEDRWAWHYGMNTKVRQDSRNICAEPIALNAALGQGRSKIVGMVVVGNPREEDTTPTLHPCEHCRLLMKHHPLMRMNTIIVTARPPTRTTQHVSEVGHEVHTFKDLLKKYGEL